MRIATLLGFRILGWKLEGEAPKEPKYVAIFAPHTSAWDALLGLGIRFGLEERPASWMIKDSVYRWPFKRLLDWLGAIPIDRKATHNVIDQIVTIFDERETLVLGITPEGTRKWVPRWKMGFYHIAKKANVPIVMAYVDFKTKTAGLGPILHPSDDMDADLAKIDKFCSTITPRHPENYGPMIEEEKSSTLP